MEKVNWFYISIVNKSPEKSQEPVVKHSPMGCPVVAPVVAGPGVPVPSVVGPGPVHTTGPLIQSWHRSPDGRHSVKSLHLLSCPNQVNA